MIRASLLAVLLVLAVVSALKPAPRIHTDGTPIIPCATEEMYYERYPHKKFDMLESAACATEGSCDNQSVRDGTTINNIVIDTVVHLMEGANGQKPDGVTVANVEAMMDRANENFGVYSISFQYTIQEHQDASYYCIDGYSGSGAWYDQVQDMKSDYAVNGALNIFISCMDFSLQGTLFGVGTFPWDAIATTTAGGLYLNSVTVTPSALAEPDTTMEHEVGHCLGLWHTFHGSEEIPGCDLACEERVHTYNNATFNSVGDFCADTMATPLTYDCSNPPGTDCQGTSWTKYGSTDYTNFMGYGTPPCSNHFTDQQELRMHCWICDELQPLLVSGC